MKNKIKKMSGFTLFEMLVVISIIAILTATISLSFSSAQKKARDSRRMSDMNAIQKAAEQYYSQNSYKYPRVQADIAGPGKIIATFPKDPKNVAPNVYTCVWDNPGGNGYCCCAPLENAGTGNANATAGSTTCSFNSTNNDYFCVQNQQ